MDTSGYGSRKMTDVVTAMLAHDENAALEFMDRNKKALDGLISSLQSINAQVQTILLRDPAAYLRIKVPDPLPPVALDVFRQAMDAMAGEGNSELLDRILSPLSQADLLAMGSLCRRMEMLSGRLVVGTGLLAESKGYTPGHSLGPT